MTEDEMVGWYHQFSGHELGQTSGDGEGQRGLLCYSPCSHKGLDTTGRLNNYINTELLKYKRVLLKRNIFKLNVY